ncbi:MAG: neutral zinc metallopeptidase [Muribaculaceae bacterium]|nr:neutral zinc metallopeptidase [Muribaculaceae bacterium]
MRLFKALIVLLAISLSLGGCSKKKRVHHDDDSSSSEMSSKCDSDSAVQTIDIEPQVVDVSNPDFSPEEQELAKFSNQIFAGTEDEWSKILNEQGLGEYRKPTLVLYTGSTSTACGQGQAAMGPFYCGKDQTIYLDMSFFSDMKQRLGADGDLAYAYMIAHEVGHHVEYLTGVLDKIHAKMRQYGPGVEANKESVRIELLADYLAGCWAHYDNERFGSLDDGDLREAIDCVMWIGDDYLQKSQGYALPERFTHGTVEQRMRWFKAGYESGDVKRGINAVLSLSYSQL